uniref:anti-sigma-I factor RsgI2-like n=1 Tax=Styela clava TaxID=7725 RepID=UPI0019399553|nr:anti-sigma-I factor RsgI2-like [Styela clava]
MNMKTFLLIASCVMLFGKGSAIMCYNCTSVSLFPVEGCGDGKNMIDEFLVECPEEKPYCSVLLMDGVFPGYNDPMRTYQRGCSDSLMNSCFPSPAGFDGTSCFTTCKTDGCNTEQTTKPVARVATLAPPVFSESATVPNPESPKSEAMVTPETTPEPTRKPEPSSTPEPETTPEPSKQPKPEPTTTPETADTTTKSDAQKVGLQIHTIINLFVCIVCTILFTGFRSN